MQILPIEENRNLEYSSSRSILTQAHAGITNAQLGLSFSDVLNNYDSSQNYISQKESNDAIYLQEYYAKQNAQAEYNRNQAKELAELDEEKLEEELDKKAKDKALAAEFAQEMINNFNNSAFGMEKNSSSTDSEISEKFISPYSMHDSEENSLALRFTKDEVENLISEMLKSGYNNTEVLSAIEQAGKNFAGTTPDEIMNVAMQAVMGETKSLTKREEQALLALSQKLSNNSENSEEAFAQLLNSNAKDVLSTLENLLSSKEEISLSKDEMAALASKMQLSDSEKNKLMQLFGENDKISLNAKNFETIFASSRQEIQQKQTQVLELANTLSEKLELLSADARKRIEFEASTQNREDKLTSQTRLQMENSILNDVLDSFKQSSVKNEALSAEFKTIESKISEMKLSQENTNQYTNTILNTKAEERREALNFQTNSSPTFADSLKSAISFTKSGQENPDTSKQSKENFNFLANAMQNNTNSTAKTATTAQVNTRFEQSFVSSQLSSNIATAAKNNVTKLEVRLNPVELGAVNIVLTAKDGELRALIQPEKEETMHTINQQIATIKRELESQGVKLEHIDVELRSDDQNSFAEAENSMQEEGREHGQSNTQEQMENELEDLNRLRILGRGINEGWLPKDALSEDDYELAQNLLQEEGIEGVEKNILSEDSYINILA